MSNKNPVGKQKAWRREAIKLNAEDRRLCALSGDPHFRQGRRHKNSLLGTTWAKIPTPLFQALMKRGSYNAPAPVLTETATQ